MIHEVLIFDVYKDGIIMHLSQARGLVGSYRMELAVVHHEPDHCYENKWLLLTGPKSYAGDPVVWNMHALLMQYNIIIIGPQYSGTCL